MKYLVILLAGLGCRGSGNDGGDTGNPTPTPTTTDATFIPEAFGVREARFALQDDGRIGPTPDGTWSLTVELVSEQGETCNAVFSGTESAAQPPFVGIEGVLIRARRPPSMPTGTCADADLPTPWDDVMSLMDVWGFSVGVTGNAEPDVLNNLDPKELAALEPYLFGGGVYLAGVDGDGDGNQDQDAWRPVAIAWGEDDQGNLVPYDDRIDDGELLPGVYVVQPQQYFTPARALLRPAL